MTADDVLKCMKEHDRKPVLVCADLEELNLEISKSVIQGIEASFNGRLRMASFYQKEQIGFMVCQENGNVTLFAKNDVSEHLDFERHAYEVWDLYDKSSPEPESATTSKGKQPKGKQPKDKQPDDKPHYGHDDAWKLVD